MKESQSLQELKDEISKTMVFYSVKAISNFFTFAPSEEYEEGYKLLNKFNEQHPQMKVLVEKTSEGYSLESACKYLTCSYLLNFLPEDIIEFISKKIPDLELAKKQGIESLLTKG
ncbi:MAG: hypothetical protein PHQ66_01960 [Candidatus Nanoarchaeia archaeon]|nr:hypothetical protein [Candidatus Nanoarchaeia archaeon]MDD5357863.1 hypothetical protein [Candidatus Nanoarchaeia archaeon]MDD5588782.1 hypothetical protein [Candidatus Nanoarchaeia archaeon]